MAKTKGERMHCDFLTWWSNCKPYLTTTLKNYTPIEFYEKLIDIFTHMTSFNTLVRAVISNENRAFKGYHPIRK